MHVKGDSGVRVLRVRHSEDPLFLLCKIVQGKKREYVALPIFHRRAEGIMGIAAKQPSEHKMTSGSTRTPGLFDRASRRRPQVARRNPLSDSDLLSEFGLLSWQFDCDARLKMRRMVL